MNDNNLNDYSKRQIEKDLQMIEAILRKYNVYIISSVDGKGNHVGRLKGFSVDADGDLVIDADIDELSCTE